MSVLPRGVEEFAAVESLLDFLGANESVSELVAKLRRSSLEELFRITGVHWKDESSNSVAEELVHLMVYLAYYGQRGGMIKTAYAEHRRTQLIELLKSSPEVAKNGA